MRARIALLFLIMPLFLFGCDNKKTLGNNTINTEQSLVIIGAVKKNGSSNPVLEKFVMLYNKNHPESPATIKYYDNEEQLKIALSTIDRPDVVELSGIDIRGIDVFFEDLYPLLDADSEYHRSDMFESVLRAFEKDGKLLSLPSSFAVRTVTGRVRQIGDGTGWSLEDLAAIKRSLGNEYTYFSPFFSIEDIMFLASTFIQKQYIDWEKYECDFECEDFLRWLELCKTCTLDNNHMVLEEWDEHILLYIEEIQTVERLEQIKTNYSGDPFVFKGFPCGDNDNGSIICKFNMSLDLAIPVNKNKDVSWRFIREILSDQWQSDVIGLSIKKNIVHEYLDGMIEKDGATITDKDADALYGLINNTKYYLATDDTVTRIIVEETAAFWEGDKGASEVARIINNRVNIYLQEKKNNS